MKRDDSDLIESLMHFNLVFPLSTSRSPLETENIDDVGGTIAHPG